MLSYNKHVLYIFVSFLQTNHEIPRNRCPKRNWHPGHPDLRHLPRGLPLRRAVPRAQTARQLQPDVHDPRELPARDQASGLGVHAVEERSHPFPQGRHGSAHFLGDLPGMVQAGEQRERRLDRGGEERAELFETERRTAARG